jgi:hypothetical protein
MKCDFCRKRIPEVLIYDEEKQRELWICFVCDDEMEWHDVRIDKLRATEVAHLYQPEEEREHDH